jgi:hypothetical protein
LDSARLKERFSKDSVEIFIDILRGADKRITSTKIVGDLVERGLPKALVKKKWEQFRDGPVKYHPHIIHPRGATYYQWSEKPVSPDEALTRLLNLLETKSKVKVPLRDELAELVRNGLKAASDITPESDEARFRATQERQSRIDGLRAVADLAGEIEELAYSSGDPEVIVERVQTLVQARSLEQIGRSGEQTTFDSSRHEAIGPWPGADAAVTVARPGYTWRTDKEEVLLQKAQVMAE